MTTLVAPLPISYNSSSGHYQKPPCPRKYRLVVFDFDNTITKVHSCKYTLDQFKSLPLTEIVADPIVFVNLVLLLRRSGRDVAIASYGRKELIICLMDRLFGAVSSPFDDINVITPLDASKELGIEWEEGFEAPTGYGKFRLLEILQKRANCHVDNSDIYLIDDSFVNCTEASVKGYGTRLIARLCRQHGFESLCEPYYAILGRIDYDAFETMWNRFIG